MIYNLAKYLTIYSLVVSCFLFLTSSSPSFETSIDQSDEPRHRIVYDEWNDCLLKNLSRYRDDPNKIWLNLRIGLRVCESLTALGKLRLGAYRNSDETKWHITPVNNKASTVVTLGIGHDTGAEEQLKPKLSIDSHFFGADPMVEINEELYARVGLFFPFAIGADAGLSVASVLNQTYVEKTVVHVNLVYFLKQILKVDIVDDIWMDVETAEYELFSYFLKGGKLDQNGITVCQLNMEIHAPDDVKKKAIRDFIFSILADGRYAVLKPIQWDHLRLYLLNFEDLTCVEKYIDV